MTDRLRELVEEHESTTGAVKRTLLPQVEQLAALLARQLSSGGKLLVFGNGGSAADAQHLAAELLGRFRRERGALPAIALTTDSSTLTAIGNDYEFADIYARQVTALASADDVVLGISTSGDAENVVRGLRAANGCGATTVALTGNDGGRIAGLATVSIVVPSDVTARIQEMHLLLIHLVCELVDDALVGDGRGA